MRLCRRVARWIPSSAAPDNTLLLTGFLLRDVNTTSQTYLPQPDENEIADLFRSSLLNPASAAFDSVRLLDRNGQVLITSECHSVVVHPHG